MELIVNNLGRLKKARIDIKPLTVLIGPNNTNKTWTAYSLYGIARSIAQTNFSNRFSFMSRSHLSFNASALLQSRVENAADDLFRLVTQAPAEEAQSRIARMDLLRGITASECSFSLNARGLEPILGIPKELLGFANVELALSQQEFDQSAYSTLEVTYSLMNHSLVSRLFTEDHASESDSIWIQLGGRWNRDRPISLIEAELKTHLIEALGMLAFTLINDAAVLPAERKALLEFDSLDISAQSDRTYAAFASPAFDFLNMIDASRNRHQIGTKSRPEVYLSLARLLERQVLQGNITSRKSGSDEPSKLTYSTHEGVELALHASASIVRALAGLDVYLKLFCNRGGLIVIDEPEMNAHPEAQLKIIEFLAIMAHYGIKVVLTTHSPYIVDHLSNLMQASALGEKAKKTIASEFKLGMDEAFISPNDVSVYLFNESGEVDDILDRNQGIIDISSFSRPTEYMANLVNAIWSASDQEISQTAELGNAF